MREGSLTKSESSSNVKKPSYRFIKKKEGETNVLIQERRINTSRRNHQHPQQVASVTLVVNAAPTTVAYQRPEPQGSQGKSQRREPFDSIPMSYAELLPALIQKKLIHTRSPHVVASPLPWYYKVDQTCTFH